MLRTTLFLIIFLVSGCASQLAVTYYSNPPGAVLYSGGQNFGYTPKTLYYNVNETARRQGYLDLVDLKVQWNSGAIAEVKSIRADLTKGLTQQLTFTRPSDIPGQEEDQNFAREGKHTEEYAKRQAYFDKLRNRCSQYGYKEGTDMFSSCMQNEARQQEVRDKESDNSHYQYFKRLSCASGNEWDCDKRPVRTNCTTDLMGNVQCISK